MARNYGTRVAVKTDEGISVHCGNACGDFDTLCGIDSNDPNIGHFGTVPVACNTKIDCKTCRSIWNTCRAYRLGDFK